MRIDYSAVEGREVVGAPAVVMQRGKTLVRDGKFLGKAGQGQFLRRGTWAL
jgi:dihydropyrimidinase